MSAPWFKFFAADWLLSPAVRLMTAEQRGIYVQLLAEQWYSGTGLPSDDSSLMLLANCKPEEWQRSKDSVLSHFPPDESGRLWNEKLRELQTDAVALSQERSAAGKRGNNARWKLGKRNAEKKTPTTKTPIPHNFGISDDVRRWAKEKGYAQLETHLEHFIGAARARGYQYANWDSAFQTAIRQNWANVPAPVVPTGPGLLERTMSALEDKN